MKAKTISNSKYKNTGVLFELLVRQITADTLAGSDNSPAHDILKKYFNVNTELGKEVQLYRAFFEGQRLTETKALHFIDLVIDQRRKLDENKLAREKYELVKDIKRHYDLKEFLSCKIPEYVVHASIYKTFLNEVRGSQAQIINLSDVAAAKFTLVEHLIRPTIKTKKAPDMLREFRAESEDMRMLTYKLLIDKFNSKYANLSDRQKGLLREYINNVPSTNSLYEYVMGEVKALKAEFAMYADHLKDKVVQIKLNEVTHQLNTIGAKKVIKDNEVTALMIAYELLKEISV